MSSLIIQNLEKLKEECKLDKAVVIWGMSPRSSEVIEWLESTYGDGKVIAVTDNFKISFLSEERVGVPIIKPYELLHIIQEPIVVLVATNHTAAIFKQLNAYGITEAYNLCNLKEEFAVKKCNLPYHFIDRRKEKKNLCYVLAGYNQELWNSTLQRISAYQSEEFDYCLISSGKYDRTLELLAEKNNWSYLYTEQNQVCYVQNLVIDLHPHAEYIIKMDEDIFIGRNFFEKMLEAFLDIEKNGNYRIGFAVPVIPLNCCGYVTYLELTGHRKEYEERFGRAYMSRFSAVFDIAETADFLWDTIDSFDEMAEKFLDYSGHDILDCYFNIGCIMYTRERWLMMGKWPEDPDSSGMGDDERYICQDNSGKDLAIYEIWNVLAGHLAFGHQKNRMMKYYREHFDKFALKEELGNT